MIHRLIDKGLMIDGNNVGGAADKKALAFPKDFLWGCSTAAYQIEGGNVNDWSEWERQATGSAERHKCGKACDSYNRWEEDIRLLKDLNCNAYRFSIEWSRIEPEEGRFNQAEIEHYRQILLKLRAENIQSFVTLWHWTNPVWVARDGGWENTRIVDRFARFSRRMAEEYGDLVNFWVTLNEPMMHIGHGYITGKFPPSNKWSFIKSYRVIRNLIAAHKASYQSVHDILSGARVGLAMTTGFIEPAHKNNPIEVAMAGTFHYLRNEWFIRSIKGYYEYIGVNYYHHDRIVWYPPFKKNLNRRTTDFGWEIYPEGIYHVLKNYQKYGHPIYILENGIADKDDKYRAEFIIDHLRYLHKAMDEGVDVRGYVHWSLMDNYEWADGYTMKFGLYEVNFETGERKPRPSAKIYAEICKNNIVDVGYQDTSA